MIVGKYKHPVHLNEMEEFFGLRTMPPQFTKGKTADTLFDISKRYLLNVSEKEEHLIDIIVTNKSLAETQQWKLRTMNTFQSYENINIHILASRNSDYKSMSDYITDITIKSLSNKRDLPNILIICYHEKRVDKDLNKLFRACSGKLNDISFKFHISFDEVDANIGVTKKFIQQIRPFIDSGVISGILFITATPDVKFWKMLNENEISSLLNINHTNVRDFNEDLKNYRTFDDHEICIHDFDTINPLDYIKDVFDNTTYICNDGQNIIFAPAHEYTKKEGVGSHAEVVAYFHSKNYCVLLMNGCFRGFKYPDGTDVTIDKFNEEYGIRGELRESLCKWKDVNPLINLAITGNNLIQRGLTLNTFGFNFTHSIFSEYHLVSVSKLIQQVGRNLGGIAYVGIIKIICPQKVQDTIIEYNENYTKLLLLNPPSFNGSDFEIKNNNSIPVKLEVINEETLQTIIYACDIDLRSLPHKERKERKLHIHDIIKNGVSDGDIIVNDRNNLKKFNISQRSLNGKRMYVTGHKTDVKRLHKYNHAFEHCKTMTQSGDNEKNYSIDLAKDEYSYDGYTHLHNVIWVTYKY